MVTLLEIVFGSLMGLVLVVTVLPWVPSGRWYFRGWDFPKMQAAVVSALALVGSVTLGLGVGWSFEQAVTAVLSALLVVWHCSFVAPFTPLWSKELRDARPQDGEPVRLVVSNLDYQNPTRDQTAEVLATLDGDVLVLIEINDDWRADLDDLAERYPHRVEALRGEGLGLALWSKLPLHGTQVKHLVSDRRASIFTTVAMPDGRRLNIIAVHPTPPGLDDGVTEGRRDSRIRDAELLKVAEHVAAVGRRGASRGTGVPPVSPDTAETAVPRGPEQHTAGTAVPREAAAADPPPGAWAVLGDFNDVAWSHTTRLFKRRSGLKDVRVGRRLLNTFHARYWMLRYPLDHVFVSEAFVVKHISRHLAPGSDHFVVLADLVWPADAPEGVEPATTDRDEADAEEMEREGEADAAEAGERRDG